MICYSSDKRILAIILTFIAVILFCFGPLCQSASAVAIVDDAIVAIIVAALAAVGITFVTTGHFNSTVDYVRSLMQQFASANGTTVASQLSGTDSAVNSYGQILINNRLVVYVDTFAKWLVYELGLSNNGVKTLQEYGSHVSNVPCYPLPVWVDAKARGNGYPKRYYNEAYTGASEVYVMMVHWQEYNMSADYTVFFSAYPHAVTHTVKEYDLNFTDVSVITDDLYILTSEDKQYNHLYVYNSSYYFYILDAAFGQYGGGYNYEYSIGENFTSTTPEAAVAALQNGAITDNEGIVIATGTITYPTSNPAYDEGDGAVIDVGASWGTTYDDVTGQVIPGEFEDSEVGDATITYDEENVIEDQIDQELSESISTDVSSYSVSGLEQIFPFCIPFDIYNFVYCLQAEPVAPTFTWRFYVPGICDEELLIDLEPFDPVADILRTLELLGFCVGLAFVTRKLIRG